MHNENIVYIVDDHNMVRNGLKFWLEQHTKWRVPKDFASSKECLDCLNCLSKSLENEDLFPAVIIVDVQLINETGFSLVQKMTERHCICITGLTTLQMKFSRTLKKNLTVLSKLTAMLQPKKCMLNSVLVLKVMIS